MPSLLRRLASIRLALILLFALALFGALGSVIPQNLGRAEYVRRYPAASRLILGLSLDQYYSGPLYRGLLTLLSANLLACAVGRSAEGWRSLRGRGSPSIRLALGDRSAWIERLDAQGYRIRSREPLYAARRTWAFLGFPLVHLSPLLILGGGLWGSLGGFVGTQNVYVGDSTETFFNWSAGAEGRLPFRLVVEDFRLLYYPIEVKVRVDLPEGGAHLAQLRVGRAVPVPGTEFQVRVDTFDAETGDMVYWVAGPKGEEGPFSKGREEGTPLKVRPTAFRDPEIRRAEAVVALSGADGKTLARQIIAINEPLVHGGVRIFLTAWDRDPKGFPYAGFQIVRDPGQPLVWLGSTALSLGLLLLLFGDGAWVREEGGMLLARASRGRRRLAGLGDDGAAETAVAGTGQNREPPRPPPQNS
jgi:cytochrome c biogenesis protein